MAFIVALVALPLVAIGGAATGGSVYPVARVEAGWRHAPRAWADRVLLVRGRVGNYFYIDDGRPGTMAVDGLGWLPVGTIPAASIAPENAPPGQARLRLRVRVDRPPMMIIQAAIHRLPLLGGLVPAPLNWLHLAGVYRIRLFSKPVCSAGACSDGVLLLP